MDKMILIGYGTLVVVFLAGFIIGRIVWGEIKMKFKISNSKFNFIIIVLCLICLNATYLLYKEKTDFDYKCGIQTNFNGDIQTYTWRPELTAELRENETSCLRICHAQNNITYAELIKDSIYNYSIPFNKSNQEEL